MDTAGVTSLVLHLVTLILLGLEIAPTFGQSIDLDKVDATVWSVQQTITGRLEGVGPEGTFYVDSMAIPFVAALDTFTVTFEIGAGSHSILACGDAGGETVCSDTLRLSLGYHPKPEVYAWAEVGDATVFLHARILDDGGPAPQTFSWRQNGENPVLVDLANDGDSVASFVLPVELPPGEYYFDVEVTNASGATGKAGTFLTQSESEGLIPFDIWSDHASWVDSAVVYEVTPYNFVANGTLQDVRERLGEFVDLGINTLWIQPLYETFYGGQGYDVTNYFRIRPDYGNANTLRTLITVAHNLGMRVMLDFVPNHTSLRHPYALDAMAHGERSHYFDFYQRHLDGAPYSRHYNQRRDGEMTFTYYFWEDLVNINYDNPEVRRWISEAGQYWIEEFDVDGYRIDAVWGVNGRTPEAMREWRFNLKRIKPDVFLLGEDKATRPESFDRLFDAAYDWYPEESWVSHWTWQYDFSTNSNPTIFNHPNERTRSNLLRDALTNRGQGWHPGAKVFRFMENNDTFRFAATHAPNALERTRMTAGLLFTLPGVPMLYNGQEIGFPTHPYQTHAVFQHGPTIARQDRLGVYHFYRHLAQMRRRYPVFTEGNYEEIDVKPASADDYVFSFLRSLGTTHALVVINMGGREELVELALDFDELELPDSDEYYLTDLMTGHYLTIPAGESGPIYLTIPRYTTAPLLITDHFVEVSVPTSHEVEPAATFDLSASAYPNPFSDHLTIGFGLERPARVVVTVFDILGRMVGVVADDEFGAGDHEVGVSTSGLAAGAYVFKLRAGDRVETGIIVKSQ